MRRNLIITILIVSLVLATGMAKAIDPFIVGLAWQMLSDKRTEEVKRNNIALRPTYNVTFNGVCAIGGNNDALSVRSYVARGAQLEFAPGQSSTTAILGFEVLVYNHGRVIKAGKYWRDFTRLDAFKNRKIIALPNEITAENPLYTAWQCTIDTGLMNQGTYPVQIRVWWTERHSSGILKLGRKSVINFLEVPTTFGIIDVDYMQRAYYDQQIQKALAASFGLTGGPVITAIMPNSQEGRINPTPYQQVPNLPVAQALPPSALPPAQSETVGTLPEAPPPVVDQTPPAVVTRCVTLEIRLVRKQGSQYVLVRPFNECRIYQNFEVDQRYSLGRELRLMRKGNCLANGVIGEISGDTMRVYLAAEGFSVMATGDYLEVK